MEKENPKPKDKTTIQVTKATLGRLKAFKIISKESFDEELNRFMNERMMKRANK